jgi:hypothetical protein
MGLARSPEDTSPPKDTMPDDRADETEPAGTQAPGPPADGPDPLPEEPTTRRIRKRPNFRGQVVTDEDPLPAVDLPPDPFPAPPAAPDSQSPQS